MEKKNLIVGQSGGPTAVINSSLYGVVSEGIKQEEIGHVYGMINGIEGFLKGTILDFEEALPGEKLKYLTYTPGAYLGSCRYKLPESLEDPVYPELFRKFEEMNIGWFFYIGGNDSMDTVSKLSRYAAMIGSDIRIIGEPKTIDNDLALTDHTPGYGSAAKYIGTSMKEIIRDSFCLEYEKGVVSIVEIMGRNAGWLTGAAALSKGEDCEGPDLIYLPELPFDLQLFGEKIKQLLQEKTSIVVAVSEGIRTEDGTYVCELGNSIDFVDAFGHKQLSGTASYLASYIAGEIGCKTRAIELSTLQRAASHAASRVDILEAYQVGGAAVKAADEGDTGKMVVLKRLSDDPYQCGTEVKDVHKIANDEKLVPRNWVNEEGTYVTNEFISYVRPLIQGDVSPVMVDGIPRHLYTPKELSHR